VQQIKAEIKAGAAIKAASKLRVAAMVGVTDRDLEAMVQGEAMMQVAEMALDAATAQGKAATAQDKVVTALGEVAMAPDRAVTDLDKAVTDLVEVDRVEDAPVWVAAVPLAE